MSDNKPVELRFLPQEEAIEAGLTDMDRCVERMAYVFELYNQGRVIMGNPGQDVHGHLTTFPGGLEHDEGLESGPDRRFTAMPAFVGGDIRKMGIKWYGSNVRTPKSGGFRGRYTPITLNDPDSGQPLVSDGRRDIERDANGRDGGSRSRADPGWIEPRRRRSSVPASSDRRRRSGSIRRSDRSRRYGSSTP